MPLRLVTAATGDANTAALPDAAAMEADHRVANNLAIIAALIRSQAANLPEEPMLPRADVRALLQQTSVRIDSVGRLHSLLTHRDGKAIVDLSAYLREVVDAVVGSLTSAEGTQFFLRPQPALSHIAQAGRCHRASRRRSHNQRAQICASHRRCRQDRHLFARPTGGRPGD